MFNLAATSLAIVFLFSFVVVVVGGVGDEHIFRTKTKNIVLITMLLKKETIFILVAYLTIDT